MLYIITYTNLFIVKYQFSLLRKNNETLKKYIIHYHYSKKQLHFINDSNTFTPF